MRNIGKKNLIIKLVINLFLFFQFDFTSFAQANFVGKYGIDKNNKEIYLNLEMDSTFTYGWRGHMWKDTSSGHYIVRNDTILLTFRPFRVDTSLVKGTQVVSFPEALSAINRPDTLFYKKRKLYRIENGQVIDKAKREKANFIKTKGWRKWYRKKYYLFGPYISKKKRIHYLNELN